MEQSVPIDGAITSIVRRLEGEGCTSAKDKGAPHFIGQYIDRSCSMEGDGDDCDKDEEEPGMDDVSN